VVDNHINLNLNTEVYALLETIKKSPFTKDIGLSVVDAHSHRVESVEEIADGIRRTLQVIPAKQIFISPDCGLKTRMTEETVGKLRNMVEATKLVRNELTGSREHGNAATRVR